MLDTGYLYAKDEKRIFINTCLGCKSRCLYCYLPKVGYKNNESKLEVRTAKQILQDIKISGYQINKETLITIGCFSECWDDENKKETIKLIKHFLKKGNQVQLSTKKRITVEEISKIKDDIKYLGQIVIFVSSASISNWNKFENKTETPQKRFETFYISQKYDIPTVLYIKPVLQGETIKDIDLYKEIIKKYDIKDVVVGSIFNEEKSDETIHFSDRNKLFYNQVADEKLIKEELKHICDIYSRSSQVMDKYKKVINIKDNT